MDLVGLPPELITSRPTLREVWVGVACPGTVECPPHPYPSPDSSSPFPKEMVPLALETEVRVLGGFTLRKSNLNPETDEILLPN